MIKGTVPLGKLIDFNQGVITGNNKIFITSEIGNNQKKVITGSDFNRYSFCKSNQYLIYDENKLHKPRKKQVFDCNEKLLLRQTGSFPITTIDENQLG